MGRLRRRAVLMAAVSGCAGAVPRPTTPAKRKGERNADVLASALVRGRTWSLHHIDQARASSASRAIRAVDAVGYLLDRAELDAQTDIDRAFAVAPHVHAHESVQVFEHQLDADRIAAAFGALGASSRGTPEPLKMFDFPAVIMTFGKFRRLVAAPEPHLLVMVPGDQILAPLTFVGCAGLPLARGGEAGTMHANSPWSSVSSFNFPSAFQQATVRYAIDGGGGARVAFRARTAHPEVAKRAAEDFSRTVEDATTLDLHIAKLQPLGPFVFEAQGRDVTMQMYLGREEVDWLVAMALMFRPGGT